MRYVRFTYHGEEKKGIWEEEKIEEIEGDFWEQFRIKNKEYNLNEVTLLSPCRPGKIVAVGLNYRKHAEELGMDIPRNPIIFIKPSTAVIGPEEEIIYPEMSKRVDYEAELGVVIKKQAFHVDSHKVSEYILGYTCFNDVTARDLQQKDIQWTRAKAFDTFAPIGPCIVSDINPDDLKIELYLNGNRKQYSRTSDFVFKVEKIVSFISSVMTLLPGDIIATGTPSGIGPMHPGDVVEVVIEKIGTLRNVVK
ncbi:fumarylacetoacetate hydrolase family protein [bacterium]|nr:fumarylacetoacetate hydrolase family protein [bacterium]